MIDLSPSSSWISSTETQVLKFPAYDYFDWWWFSFCQFSLFNWSQDCFFPGYFTFVAVGVVVAAATADASVVTYVVAVAVAVVAAVTVAVAVGVSAVVAAADDDDE